MEFTTFSYEPDEVVDILKYALKLQGRVKMKFRIEMRDDELGGKPYPVFTGLDVEVKEIKDRRIE